MTKGIVIQLQEEALDENIDVETLLRKAFLVARKLQLKEFEKWIQCEQNGYKNEVPEYRKIGGSIKAWNPYHGWCPVIFQGEIGNLLQSMPLINPIATISDLYNNKDGDVGFSVSSWLTDSLNNNNTDGFITQYTFQSSKAEIKKIISAVRNKILEWAIILEENGIHGEGLSFSEEEKKLAKESSVINNYTNNFYASAENVQIQQGSSGQQVSE